MKNQPIIFCSDALDGEDQEEETSRADTMSSNLTSVEARHQQCQEKTPAISLRE